jgi:hypothetical protein
MYGMRLFIRNPDNYEELKKWVILKNTL